jgi:hypothetical protein
MLKKIVSVRTCFAFSLLRFACTLQLCYADYLLQQRVLLAGWLRIMCANH